ncbi:DUF4240 domain-containing protein [Streptomyces sp. bgisy060]|uniref:DUF4240 domain-containing protein n=1 Tax=Streptomyces sp. bgisy060 TaxID=3413775 RepID=UPI003EB9C5A8
MDIDEFWQTIAAAQGDARGGRPFHEALVDRLAVRPREEIVRYALRFEQLHDGLERWDVWAAAYLIGGGCSDDGFTDFRAGVIGLGREWYERVVAHPDDLAEHPGVKADAVGSADVDLFYEEINYVADRAFARTAGDDEDFYSALESHQISQDEGETGSVDMGEDFDFDDDEEMRQRLPRLAALYLRNDSK